MPGTLKLNSGGAGNLILTPSGSVGSDVTVTLPAATATLLTNKTAGTVLQVVQGSIVAASATTSTSYVASSLAQAITPTAATSKILILVSSIAYCASNESGYFTIYRNSTELSGVSGGFSNTWFAGQRGNMPIAMNYLDSPATTSSTTYTVYYKSGGGGEVDLGQANLKSTITLMEIAA